MRRTLLSAISVLLFLGSMFLVGGTSDGTYVDTFNGVNGPNEDMVVLKGAGTEIYDSHLFIDLEKNVPISKATMKVSTMDSKMGPWIKEPSIDLGIDNDPEWSFSGTGYGDFGRNTAFDDETTMKTSTYNDDQIKTMGNILIPADSEIHQSDITLRGRFEPTIPSLEKLASGGKISYTPKRLKTGDLTGDGLNDTIIANGQPGSLYLYEGSGGGVLESRSLGLSNVNDFVIYDMDDDNDMDLVYSTNSGFYWKENTGSGTLSTNTHSIQSDITPYLITVADLNDDGNDDLVIAKRSFNWGINETVMVLMVRDNGADHHQFPVFNTGSGSGTSLIDFIDIGDWNDDGYDDVFGAFSDRKVFTFQNPALSTYFSDTSNLSGKVRWTDTRVFTDSSPIYDFDVGDVDGDGDADAVTASYAYTSSVYYWRNNGKSTWSKYSTLSGYSYYPRTAQLVDINNDGNLDIFFSVGNSYWNNGIGWLDSKGNPNKTSWTRNDLMTGHPNFGSGGFTGDLDNDGYMDVGLFITTSNQALVWFNKDPHDGTNISPGFIEDGGLVELSDLEQYDVDKDGDVDFLITAYVSGTVGWFENDGTPFDNGWKFHRINGVIVGGAKEVAPGDIDNDGDVDVAVSSYDTNTIMWFENPGNASHLWEYHKVGSMNYAMGVGVIDMDNDGQLEIVASAGYYYNDGIRGYYHSGDPGGSWNYFQVASSLSYCGAINITDMNKDGYDDIIVPVNGYSGSANIYRNPYPKNAKTNSWVAISAIGGLSYPQEAIPFDIDGNGVLDVVSASNYGSIKWGRAPNNPNSTGGWSGFEITSANSVQYPWGVEVGDIDEDGFADVFITNNYRWSWTGANDKGLYWFEEGDDNTELWQKRNLDTKTKSTYGVAVADLDNDGVIEIFLNSRGDHNFQVSRPTLNYPSDVKIDLGRDGVVDWSKDNTLNGIIDIDLTEEMQYVVDREPAGTSILQDSYGNRMISIPISLSTKSKGRLTAWGIDIRYNVTFEIDNGESLKNAIDRIVPDYGSPGDSNLRVYVLFKGKSEGRAFISNMSVEYNSPPKQMMKLPEIIEVDEDSSRDNVLDLSKYFTDDYDEPEMLRYSLAVYGEDKDKIDVYLEEGAKVSVDSTLVKNFNGEAYVRFYIEDNGGPGGVPSRKISTKGILIDVIPKDDPAIEGNGSLPNRIYGYEGQEVMAIDLEDRYLFEDPDDKLGLSIRYYPVLDPDGTYPRELEGNISVRVTYSKIYIEAVEDWSGLNIPLRIYGYDSISADTTSNPYKMTYVDILDINDGPRWLEVPDSQILEDTNADGLIDLSYYAADIDTPHLELDYKLISQTNSTHVKVYLDLRDHSKVNIDTLTPNWYGSTTVQVEVSDGEYSDLTEFRIDVIPENDPPSIKIKGPIEDKSVVPGEFSVTGEAYDVEGISKVEVLFEGIWKEATGKNYWGITLIAPNYGELRTDVPIKVKVTDTDGVENYDYVNITVLEEIIPLPTDIDGDGYLNNYDDFPYDPSEWRDTDRDGLGDNEDAFPKNREWKYDTDKDGIADVAEEEEMENDPENQEVLPPSNRDDEGPVYDLKIPIALSIIALILMVIVVVSIMGYLNKRKASKDPRLSVAYYNNMEIRREKWKRITGREKMESLLSKAQLKDINQKNTPGPAPLPSHYNTPQAVASPQQIQISRQLPPPPVNINNTGRMPPGRM